MSNILKGTTAVGGLGTAGGVAAVIVINKQKNSEIEELKIGVKNADAAAIQKVRNGLSGVIADLKLSHVEDEALFRELNNKFANWKTNDKLDVLKVFADIKEGIQEKIKETEEEGKDKKAFAKIKTVQKRSEVALLKDKELEGLDGFEGLSGENNVCELVQREVVRRILKNDYRWELSDKGDLFYKGMIVCFKKD